jgi:predicted nucleotide-binding protein
MVRKSQKSEEQPKQPLLLKMTREEAAEKLSKRLAEGTEKLDTQVGSEEQYEELKASYNKWNDYNLFLLRGMFTTDEIAEEYNRVQGAYAIASSWYERYEYFKGSFRKKMTKIESIIDRLELMPVVEIQQQAPQVQEHINTKPQAVFIGHGRSTVWARVKAFLSDDFGIKSFSFESKTHVGESIVPILEGFLEEATFAIIVLTAEDETAEGTIRARQNVVHEAGLFQGKLGFKRAIVLRQEGLEDFSNVDGLQYIGFTGDKIDQTFYELTRVLKREGIVK